MQLVNRMKMLAVAGFVAYLLAGLPMAAQAEENSTPVARLDHAVAVLAWARVDGPSASTAPEREPAPVVDLTREPDVLEATVDYFLKLEGVMGDSTN